ncbi:SGNH/GDSL hydrolase family protein [Bacteroidota bacterium]
MKVTLTTLFVIITSCILSSALGQTNRIAPSDPNIMITGRTYQNADGHIEFDWPGVSIAASFSGNSISLIMDDTGLNFYNVFIDNALQKVITVSSDTILLLADHLAKGPHALLLTKRTEGFAGKATFKGILLDDKGKILQAGDRPEKKIEFIGNSITCGYGTEAKIKEEDFKPETENNYKSYAPITARAFGANAHIIAHSGQGVVRNYGYKKKVSEYTMPDRYLQVFDEQKEPLWDFTSWKPDLVVINLGTNDFSTQPQPDEEVFVEGYMNLIGSVREQYGKLPVFCIVGPMTNEPCYSYVKKMVETLRTKQNDQNVYFIGIPVYLLEEADWGAYHPKYSGQIKMAGHVVPVIASVMGWEYGEIK